MGAFLLSAVFGLGGHIRCCGNGFLGFRPYGGSLFPNARNAGPEKSNQKGFTLTYGPRCGSGSFAPGLIRGHRLRFASLHLLSMHAAAPHGRCAPTPGSIPPLSLPTGPAIKSGTRANAHRGEWGGAWRVWLLIWLWLWLLIFCPFGRPSGGVHQGVGAQRRAAQPHTSRGGAAKQTVGDAP